MLILAIVGALGAIVGTAWAIDEWFLPKYAPQITLLIGNYPWVGWLSRAVIIVSVIFFIGLRIGRKRGKDDSAIQPPPVVPPIPHGATRMESVTDYPSSGKTRTVVTIDYLDGLPTTPNVERRMLFQEGIKRYRSAESAEAIKIFKQLMEGNHPVSEKMALLILTGNSFLSTSRLQDAGKCYSEAIELGRQFSEKEGLAAALGNIGIIYRIRGEPAKALENYQEALKIDREIGNRQGEAKTLDNMGIVYRIRGELEKALQNHMEALKIYREVGYRHGEASALRNLGVAYGVIGELDKLLQNNMEALKIDREIGNRQGEAASLGNLGIVYEKRGELNEALQNNMEALKIDKEIGDREGEANDLLNLGNVYQTKGELDKALQNYQEALVISKEIGYRQGEAYAYGNMGIVYVIKGKPGKALQNFEAALKIDKEIGAVDSIDKIEQAIRTLKGQQA